MRQLTLPNVLHGLSLQIDSSPPATNSTPVLANSGRVIVDADVATDKAVAHVGWISLSTQDAVSDGVALGVLLHTDNAKEICSWCCPPQGERGRTRSAQSPGKDDEMSWNAFHFTLSPGQSFEPGYTWNDDHGPQMALPREFTGSTRNNLLTAQTQSVFRDSNNNLSYFVSIKNRGGNVATFELFGGNLG